MEVAQFKCTFTNCGKAFKRKGDLTRHILLHSGVKPHVCRECKKAFSQASALKTHLNVHSGAKPYVCNVLNCGARFGDPSSKTRHHKETHEVRTKYRCPMPACSAAIKRSSSFRTHLRRVHNLNPSAVKIEDYLESLFYQDLSSSIRRTSPKFREDSGSRLYTVSPAPGSDLIMTPQDELTTSNLFVQRQELEVPKPGRTVSKQRLLYTPTISYSPLLATSKLFVENIEELKAPKAELAEFKPSLSDSWDFSPELSAFSSSRCPTSLLFHPSPHSMSSSPLISSSPDSPPLTKIHMDYVPVRHPPEQNTQYAQVAHYDQCYPPPLLNLPGPPADTSDFNISVSSSEPLWSQPSYWPGMMEYVYKYAANHVYCERDEPAVGLQSSLPSIGFGYEFDGGTTLVGKCG